jgi:DNA primase
MPPGSSPRRQIRPEELVEVGLAQPRQGSRGGVYDRFRARVIFPIRDANAGPVGLGGRLLGSTEGGDAGPKYLNSPATPLFDKSRTLYLIDRAKSAIRKSGQAVLVEGYTDALMAHQAGFDNVVASLGTALTPGQVAILAKHAKRIALAYDVDPAGQSAGTFGVTELNSLIGEVGEGGRGIGLTDVGVVRLPDGKDPDEVIREAPEVWRAAAEQPVRILDYLIDSNAEKADIREADGRRRLIDAVLPVLRRVADPMVRDAALLHLARRSATDVEILREAMRRPGLAGGSSTDGDHAGARLTLEAVRAAADELSPAEVVRAVTPREAELLRLLLRVPELQERAISELGPDLLPSTLARQLYRAIVDQRAPDDAGVDGAFDLESLLASVDDETRALGRAVLLRGGPDPRSLSTDRQQYELAALVLALEADQLEERSSFNLTAQAEAELSGDVDATVSLLAQARAIDEARRSLDRRRDEVRLLARPKASVPA